MELVPTVVALIDPDVASPFNLLVTQIVRLGVFHFVCVRLQAFRRSDRQAVRRETFPGEEYRLHVRFSTFRGYPRPVKEVLHPIGGGFPENQCVPAQGHSLIDGQDRLFGPLPECDFTGVDIVQSAASAEVPVRSGIDTNARIVRRRILNAAHIVLSQRLCEACSQMLVEALCHRENHLSALDGMSHHKREPMRIASDERKDEGFDKG